MNYSLDSKKNWQKTLRPLVQQKRRERDSQQEASLEPEENHSFSVWAVFWAILSAAAIILFVVSCDPAHAQSDEQIVNAIYKAEGGSNAQYPYGIRSIKCSTNQQCKKICLNTVRNNRKRFRDDTSGRYKDYLEFLASRYCPVGHRDATQAEKRLNQFWLKNVRYFLAKDGA